MTSVLYGLERYETPTPGGNRVAAVALFSATSPFDRLMGEDERCAREVLPTSPLPIFGVSRTCDAVPCDLAQRERLWGDGNFADVLSVDEWEAQLRDSVGAALTWRLIGDRGVTRLQCDPSCSLPRATINHVSWPNGVRDLGGIDHEPDMLSFLRDHPRTGESG